MRRQRKQNANKPKNTVDTIFFEGKLLQGFKDNTGRVYADDGNVYQYNKAGGRWECLTTGKVKLEVPTTPTDIKPVVKLNRSRLGEIVVMDDGSAYQYQDVDGDVALVCILKNPPAFVSLSYVRGSIHGRVPGRTPSR